MIKIWWPEIKVPKHIWWLAEPLSTNLTKCNILLLLEWPWSIVALYKYTSETVVLGDIWFEPFIFICRRYFTQIKWVLDVTSLNLWNFIPLPAKCKGVECRPWVSRQFTLSGEDNFFTLAKQPFLAASNKAESPLSRSWISVSPSLTRSKGVLPSLFFFVGSAPCWAWEKRKRGTDLSLSLVNEKTVNVIILKKTIAHWDLTLEVNMIVINV